MHFNKIIKKYGKENLIFLVPMLPANEVMGMVFTDSSDTKAMVPAKIDETVFEVDKGFKIELKSLIPAYGTERFYQSDLLELIKQGAIKVMADVSSQVKYVPAK